MSPLMFFRFWTFTFSIRKFLIPTKLCINFVFNFMTNNHPLQIFCAGIKSALGECESRKYYSHICDLGFAVGKVEALSTDILVSRHL